jgi:hypothetical protein
VKVQLLLLGVVAALTVSAVSMAGSVPSASVTAEQPSVASSATSTEATRASTVAPVAAPAVSEAAAPEPVTITTEIVQQPVVALASSAEPAAIPAVPAACAAAIQVIQAAPGGRALGRPAIASAIADCFGQSPTGIPPLKNKKVGSGGQSGAGNP